MANLKIMPYNGNYRHTWYGRVTRHGKKVNINLKIPIEGTVPVTYTEDGNTRFDIWGEGDEAFRKSRDRAIAEMEKLVKKSKDGTSAIDREKRIFRLQTGKAITQTKLSELTELWLGRIRAYTPTKQKQEYFRRVFTNFAKFASRYATKHNSECATLETVTTEISKAFFDCEMKEYTATTVYGHMSLLRSAYQEFVLGKKDGTNPFDVIKRNREEAHRRSKRQALTEEQVQKLFNISRNDPFFHALIVAACCTGLRIGDLCNLSWSQIDLYTGIITVPTAKTGETATIPIFTPLKEILEKAITERKEGERFVFPEAARRYNYVTPNGVHSLQGYLSKGVKPYLAMALDDSPQNVEDIEIDNNGKQIDISDEAVIQAIRSANFTSTKRDRLSIIYDLYKKGNSYSTIAATIGKRKGSISDDLKEIEHLVGKKIRPGVPKNKFTKGGKTISKLIGSTMHIRKLADGTKVGKRQASDYCWHTFRATFATIAINNARLPLDKVRKILGHSNEEMTADYDRATKKHEAERIRLHMEGTVLGRKQEVKRSDSIEINEEFPPLPSSKVAPSKTLAIALAVLSKEERAQVEAVLRAAEINMENEKCRALSILLAVVSEDSRQKIQNVCNAAR